MSKPNQDPAAVEAEEQLFVRKALARVEKAESDTSPELKVEVTVLIGVALVVAACTTKIMALSNKNTKDVLQAIANLPQNRV